MPCTICLTSKRWYHNIRKLKCGHKYHLECINIWSHQNKTCPVCRIEILPQNDLSINEFILAEKNKHPSGLSSKDILYKAGIE